MAVKSVLSIDVEDQAFANLKRRYDQFDASVRKLPAEWRKLSAEMVGTQDLFKSMLGMSVAIAGALKEAERVEVHRSRVTDNSLRQWKHIAREARDFAASVRGATLSIGKWVGLGGILGGAGALFGLDRMAQNVAGARQFAMGVGTTIGGARAFEVNMGRLVDPKAFLQSVSQARMSPEGRVALQAQGFTNAQIEGDVTRLAAGLIQRAKEFADRTPRFMTEYGLRGALLDRFFGGMNIETLRNMRMDEVKQLQGGLTEAPRMEIPGAKQWQDFLTAISRAEAEIDAVFVKGLTPIVEPFRKLAIAAPDLLEAFLKAPFLKKWMEDIAGGLEEFARYIGTDEFKQKVEAFARGLDAIVRAMGRFVSFFGGGEPTKEPAAGAEPLLGRTSGEAASKLGTFAGKVGHAIADPLINFRNLPVVGGRDEFKGVDTEEIERQHLRAKLIVAHARRLTNMMTPGEPAIEPPKKEAKQYRRILENLIEKKSYFEQDLRSRLIQETHPWSDFKSKYHHAPPGWSIVVSPQAGSDSAYTLNGTKGGG